MPLLLACALAATGCGIAEHMEIRAGMEPKHEDEDVRFRTTYYFRVFDLCRVERRADGYSYASLLKPESYVPGDANIRIDSLYRFRMTGKAHPLANRIRFESGTLSKWEIDPFGATVRYDKETGAFEFKSAPKNDGAARSTLIDRIRELAKLRAELAGSGDIEPAAALSGAIVSHVELLRASTPGRGGSVPRDLSALASNLERAGWALTGYNVDRLEIAGTDPVPGTFLGGIETARSSLLNAGKALGELPAQGSDARAKLGRLVAGIKHARASLARAQVGPASVRERLSQAKKHLAEPAEASGGAHGPLATSDAVFRVLDVEHPDAPLISGEFEEAAGRLDKAAATAKSNADAAMKRAVAPDASEADVQNARTEAAKENEKAHAYETAAKFIRDVKAYRNADILNRLERALEAYDSALSAAKTFSSQAASGAALCEGGQSRRGFQILGPEGWRTFDQDERLIMAMSSSNRPLIGALQELSGRFLREQPSGSELLLAVAQERLLFADARRLVDLDTTSEPDALIEAVSKGLKSASKLPVEAAQ